MTGRLTALTAESGTLVSNTEKACPYTFPRANFFGDWDELQADFAAGTGITMNYKPHADTGIATVVRRIP